MSERRVERLNSLLKEVISDVIHKEMKNPHLPPLVTVTGVQITKDLRHAKVYVSIIGDQETKIKAISILQSASGFIALHSSKHVVMRFFPDLMFILDESVEKQMQIDSLISKIQKERESRESKG
jgi:ribosome-binding factor A